MFSDKQVKCIIIFLISFICFIGNPLSSFAQLGNLTKGSGKVLTKEELAKFKAAKKEARKNPRNGHSPHKATLYSLALPGLGQAYNKKYWKIPIIYAGFAGLGYLIVTNKNQYTKYKNALEYDPNDPNAVSNEYVKLSESQLKSGRDLYRKNLDLSIILTALWWALNIVDATVDAHLFKFDVTEDLSLRVEPDFRYQPYNKSTIPGLRISINLPFSKH
jgi:hypothetical protein